MRKFIENFELKWQNDKKFQAKMKLLGFALFLVAVSIYASSINSKTEYNNQIPENNEVTQNNNETSNYALKIPEEYDYTITIEMDNKKYEYIGKKMIDRELIQKKVDNVITNYMYQNNTYYIEDNVQTDNYIITTRDEVYDVINYNYINLNTINEYLTKATKNDNQYLVYLKDIVLGNNSDNYFVIDINENIINVDYTVLMKEFNKDISKYIVTIEIKEKE